MTARSLATDHIDQYSHAAQKLVESVAKLESVSTF